MHNFDQTMLRIEYLLGQGGGSAQWFAQAFLSWLSHDTRHLVDLCGVERLDGENFDLFVEMLRLRRDQQLREADRQKLVVLAEYAKQRWGSTHN